MRSKLAVFPGFSSKEAGASGQTRTAEVEEVFSERSFRARERVRTLGLERERQPGS
jgi:hypothetical protein